MSRILYGLLVFTAVLVLFRQARSRFDEAPTRYLAYYLTYVFFAYWYVTVLNYSNYTATPVPYLALTLIKDGVWLAFLGWFLVTGHWRKIPSRSPGSMLLVVLMACIPALVFGNTLETANLLKSVVLYLPLLWIAASLLRKRTSMALITHALETGAAVGGLAVLQLLLGVKTYLELQRASYPRAVATFGGPTPLAMGLLFVCFVGLAAVVHRPEYRSYRVYGSLCLAAGGVVATTAVSPMVGASAALVVLTGVYLAVNPDHVGAIAKLGVLAASIGSIGAYAIPLIRYRLLGGLGFALDNPIAYDTYYSRQARIEQLATFSEAVGQGTFFELLFGHHTQSTSVEVLYLDVFYEQGAIAAFVLLAFLCAILIISLRTYVGTESPHVRIVAFATIGYLITFAVANIGSPVWIMFPANVLLYLLAGWMTAVTDSDSEIDTVPEVLAGTGSG